MTGDETGAVTTADATSGHWLGVIPTARALGVTERTVRRRMAAGTVRTRRDGHKVLVWVSDGDIGRVSDEDSDESGTASRLSDERPDSVSDVAAEAIHEFGRLLEQERQRSSAAEQAAAMWQERARTLEEELERVLALPAHEEEPALRGHWWQWWRTRA